MGTKAGSADTRQGKTRESKCARSRLRGDYANSTSHRLSLRLAIELLSGRVNQLSQFIISSGLEVPPMSHDDNRILSGILETLGLPLPQANWSGRSDQVGETVSVPDESPALHRPLETDTTQERPRFNASESGSRHTQLPPIFDLESGRGMYAAGHPTSTQIDELASSGSSINGDLVDQLSDRVGTLYVRPGGHIRFFGPTSNFNLLETPSADRVNIHQAIRIDGLKHLDRLDLSKEVPSLLEDHLVNLYFTWQDPAFHVVDREMYENSKIQWHDGQDTAYYSEALRNAM